jgi:hypothetical protein
MYVNVPTLGRVISKKINLEKNKNKNFLGILKATEEKSSIRFRNPVYGSEDPDLDPY